MRWHHHPSRPEVKVSWAGAGMQPFFPQKGPFRRFPRRGLERLRFLVPGSGGRSRSLHSCIHRSSLPQKPSKATRTRDVIEKRNKQQPPRDIGTDSDDATTRRRRGGLRKVSQSVGPSVYRSLQLYTGMNKIATAKVLWHWGSLASLPRLCLSRGTTRERKRLCFGS